MQEIRPITDEASCGGKSRQKNNMSNSAGRACTNQGEFAKQNITEIT